MSVAAVDKFNESSTMCVQLIHILLPRSSRSHRPAQDLPSTMVQNRNPSDSSLEDTATRAFEANSAKSPLWLTCHLSAREQDTELGIAMAVRILVPRQHLSVLLMSPIRALSQPWLDSRGYLGPHQSHLPEFKHRRPGPPRQSHNR